MKSGWGIENLPASSHDGSERVDIRFYELHKKKVNGLSFKKRAKLHWEISLNIYTCQKNITENITLADLISLSLNQKCLDFEVGFYLKFCLGFNITIKLTQKYSIYFLLKTYRNKTNRIMFRLWRIWFDICLGLGYIKYVGPDEHLRFNVVTYMCIQHIPHPKLTRYILNQKYLIILH